MNFFSLLPNEITLEITSSFGDNTEISLYMLSKTCKQMNNLCKTKNKKIYKQDFIEQAVSSSLECYLYLEKHSYKTNNLCNLAAKTGSLECLKYAHENSCPSN